MLGYNVYAYCANDPVNNIDFTGEFVISTAVLIGIGIGALIGGIAGRALIYEAVRNNIVVRYAIIDGIIKISDAWVKTR